MSENILVVEYEPRYTDRVRQALVGQPFVLSFAKDGEEAMRALDEQGHPRLIVLSSIVPRISTTELIRAIRGRNSFQATPILLTVSGYNGKSPKQDAERVGASDILPKPYSEGEFLGKVQQMLGVRVTAAPTPAPVTATPVPPPTPAQSATAGGLTSNEIFGDLLDDAAAASPGATKPMSKQKDDLDKLLADTLGGVMPQKKKEPAAQTAPVPAPAGSKPDARPRTQTNAEFDQHLSDTLSGLEKSARKTSTSPGNVPAPQPVPPPAAPRPATPPPAAAAPAAAAPEAKRFNTEKLAAYVPDRVPVSQPVFAPPAPAPVVHHEEDASDGTKFGQYVLLEKIATGGMAEVWKARMRGVEGFQKIVAIKKILPHLSDNQDFIEMFVDEAKLAAQLNHNNIIHIYDLGKITNSYYIAMEYVDGHDLKTILKRGQDRDQPMGVEVALLIAAKLAAALDYAHRKRDFEDKEMGLVHRDVSPQNVLISEEGDIKLCDFGIAKAASKASHTQAGALKGKLQYMSPEQAWGRHIDKRSDIFALATVLFEMLAGRKLFTGDNELSILEQVREARVTKPSDINDEVPPEVDAIVVKALQKDPAMRYQTAGEMERDLNQVLYNFKPTPTSADIAIFMHRLWSPDAVMHHEEYETVVEKTAPAPVPVPVPAPVHAAPVAAAVAPTPVAHAAAEPWEQPRAPKKGSPIVPIAIAAVVLLAAVGGYLALKGGGSDTPAQTASVAPAPRPAANTGTIVPAPAAGDTAGTSTLATTATSATSLDPNLVNQEVQKRLAAERARLEAERARAAAAATATTAPGRPATTPVIPAPAPVTAAPVPAPQPVAPAPVPQPAVAETRPTPQPADPEPAPARPAAAAVREGDLVEAGTPGLVPPKLVKEGNVPYPPLARAQRVGGKVTMNVLVSENGRALEVRLISGVQARVGLNEAAEQRVRRSEFRPATKDGVRVKTWMIVALNFQP